MNKWTALAIIGACFAFALMVTGATWAESNASNNKPYVIEKDGKQVVCIYDIREWKCE